MDNSVVRHGFWVCAVFLHWRSHVQLSHLNVTVCRPTGTAIVGPVGSPSSSTVRLWALRGGSGHQLLGLRAFGRLRPG